MNATRFEKIATKLDMNVIDFFPADQASDVISLIDVADDTTLRMLQAYVRIADQATQRQMVELIETIAKSPTPSSPTDELGFRSDQSSRTSPPCPI